MLRFIVRRVLLMIPTLFIISALVYFIIDLPPGDCVTAQIDELLSRGDPDALRRAEELRAMYGLNDPLWLRYLEWVEGIFRWDFGLSCQDTVPVKDLIGERIALTMIMEACTIAFIWIVSFVIGVYAATHQYQLGDYVASFVGFIGLAVPSFLLALVSLYVGKVYFGLSIGGLMDPEFIDKPISWEKVLSVSQHLIIPVIVIGTSGTAGMIRRLRANLLDELQKQYVTTGRAKGLPPLKLLIKYPLRHAINPFVADIGHLLPEFISGSALVSVVLSLPTTGPILVRALQTQDMYLAGSFLMLESFLVVIGLSGTAAMIRRLRANLLDELQKQYVVTGRAKGLPPRRLLVKYPLRMSLNPFISDIGNLLPSVVSGSAIVSVVLSLQTVGPMLLDALQSQDQYLAGSFLMFLSLLTVIGVFISDLLLAALDPRIRLSGGATK